MNETPPFPDHFEQACAMEYAQCAENTDVHLWPQTARDAYAPTVHGVTEDAIGINVGGLVIVQPIRTWHAQARRIEQLEAALTAIRKSPTMPFPDPGAHSYQAWGQAVFRSWAAIQRIACSALQNEVIK